LLGILFIIIFFEWRQLFNITGISYWLLLPFYPVLPFALLIYLNQHPLYHALLLDLFILVASFDTGSYIGGTLFGKHVIIPRISPKKTWEGVIIGYIFATIGFSMLVCYEQGKLLTVPFMLGFSAIICCLAFLGDLFESWLKRRAHLKNSGDFLPGHGGFLDRFDGIMFAVFFFFIFRNQLVRLLG
jgi:phosphatidate cytidylyltransferase